jgi:hypothetical protein
MRLQSREVCESPSARWSLLIAVVLVTVTVSVSYPQQPKPKTRVQKPAAPSDAKAASPEWPQWGGPLRNFKAEAKGLAAQWPENGPRQLWRRQLGEGHSSIAVDNGKLYTMYSQGERDHRPRSGDRQDAMGIRV